LRREEHAGPAPVRRSRRRTLWHEGVLASISRAPGAGVKAI